MPVPVTFNDNGFIELFFVFRDAESGTVWTSQYYETGSNEKPIAKLKSVNWEVEAPPEATLFFPSAGLSLDELQMAWIGWRENQTLTAISLFHEQPLVVDLEPADVLIEPAVVLPDRRMVHYLWRATEGAWTLQYYVFSGEHEQPTSVGVEHLMQIEGEPVLSTLEPATGEGRGRVALGWVELLDETVLVNASWLNGLEGVSLRETVPEAIALTVPQRMGLHLGREDHLSLSFIAERPDDGTYLFVKTDFDFVSKESRSSVQALRLDPESLHAACIVHLKNPPVHQAVAYFLTKEGTLLSYFEDSAVMQILRTNVDLAYDFPIGSARLNICEVHLNEEGEWSISPLH